MNVVLVSDLYRNWKTLLPQPDGYRIELIERG